MLNAEGDSDCGEVLEWFARFSGGAVPTSRRGELEAGIRRVMQANGITSTARLKDALTMGHRVLDGLISELTVGETYFFRDPHHFDMIRDRVLPEFRATQPEGTIFNAWSAGCATGEEAYSLAILLDDLGMIELSRILATDISRASLHRALSASYGAWSFRSDSAKDIKRHFHKRGSRFVLDERIRNRVSFRFGNLAVDQDTEAGGESGTGMNLILCRNVMIYFSAAAIRRLARILFGALVPGGWLIVGPSDPPLWDFAPFEVISTAGGIFYRRPGPQTAMSEFRIPAAKATDHVKAADHVRRIDRAARPPATLQRATRRNVATELNVPPARTELPVTAGSSQQGKPRKPATEKAKVTEDDAAASARLIRAAADAGSPDLAAIAEAAAKAHPLDIEIQYLQAVIHLGERRFEAACATARRLVYLDSSLVMGHFILATALTRAGQKAAARRSYRRVEALCSALPSGEKVRFADGETAGMLCAAARLHLQADSPV